MCELSRWASSWTSRSAEPYGLICSPEQVRPHLVSHIGCDSTVERGCIPCTAILLLVLKLGFIQSEGVEGQV